MDDILRLAVLVESFGLIFLKSTSDQFSAVIFILLLELMLEYVRFLFVEFFSGGGLAAAAASFSFGWIKDKETLSLFALGAQKFNGRSVFQSVSILWAGVTSPPLLPTGIITGQVAIFVFPLI